MPGWKVWGNPWTTAEMSNTDKFQPIVFNKNIILRAIRTWIIVVGDPAFTSLNCKIYSNEEISGDNTPKKLLHTSTNSLLKADIHTLANGVKEVWFEFDYAPMNENDIYNFVITGVGYTYGESSHLAWMHAFPDPVYSGGYTPAIETLPYAPYQLYCIGGEF